MSEYTKLFERAAARYPEPELSTDGLLLRGDRRHRNQRIAAGVLGIAIAFAAGWWGINAIRTADHTPADEPKPPDQSSELMWPQSSPREVREAQELADAGDPQYTWQVAPELMSGWSQTTDTTEIVARFLREELGWEEFRLVDPAP